MPKKEPFFVRGYQRPSDSIQMDQTGGHRPSQPSQRFPFRAVTPPRVDNINQPWYGGSRASMRGPQDAGGGVDPITQSSDGWNLPLVSGMWKSLDQFFGSFGPSKQYLNMQAPSISQFGSEWGSEYWRK